MPVEVEAALEHLPGQRISVDAGLLGQEAEGRHADCEVEGEWAHGWDYRVDRVLVKGESMTRPADIDWLLC